MKKYLSICLLISLSSCFKYAIYNQDLNGLFNYPTAIFENADSTYDEQISKNMIEYLADKSNELYDSLGHFFTYDDHDLIIFTFQ